MSTDTQPSIKQHIVQFFGPLGHHARRLPEYWRRIDWRQVWHALQQAMLWSAAMLGRGIREAMQFLRELPRHIRSLRAYARQALADYRATIDRMNDLDGEHEVTRVRPRSMDVGKPVRQGLFLLFITFGVFGTWSAVAPLARGAHAPGMISLDGNRKTVQHLEGGIISEILVKEGEQVKAGQVLIRMDDTRSRAQFEIFQGRRDELLAREARLMAEKEGLSTLTFPEILLERQHDPKVTSLINDQQQIFEARTREFNGQVDILSRKIDQLKRQIEGMNAEQAAKEEQLRLIKEEHEGLKKLLDKGYSSRTRVLALERAAASISGERGSLESSIARTEVAIGEAELEIIQLEQTYQRDVLDRLRDVRAKLSDVNAQIAAAEDQLKRTEILSPATGQVVGLNVHTAGGVVAPGTTLVSVVPVGERLMVEAEVQPIDIDTVHAGMEAEIRLPGLPMRSTPLLNGTVISISGDALENPRNGNQYYLARVEVAPEELARLGDVHLVPGMPAEILIKAGERTPLDYILSPFTRIVATSMRED